MLNSDVVLHLFIVATPYYVLNNLDNFANLLVYLCEQLLITLT